MDEVTMLTSLTIFLLYSSAEAIIVEPLQTRCIQAFRASLESKDPVVSKESRLEILNTITTVLLKNSVFSILLYYVSNFPFRC